MTPPPLWRQLADYTVKYEGGGAAPYSALNQDGEYEGLFDRPKKDAKGNKLLPSQRVSQPGWAPHSASRYRKDGGYHIGLSFGAWQFTQDGGALGHVLSRAARLDRAAMDRVFGGRDRFQTVLELTNRSGTRPAAKPGGARSPRVQPLEGADLWQEPWASRFRAAGREPAMQAAQQDQAIYGYMIPAANVMRERGFKKPSTLAVLFDIAIQYGKTGMSTRVAAQKGSNEDDVVDRVIAALEPHRQERRRAIRAAASALDGQDALSARLDVGAPPSVAMTGIVLAGGSPTQEDSAADQGSVLDRTSSWLRGVFRGGDAEPEPDALKLPASGWSDPSDADDATTPSDPTAGATGGIFGALGKVQDWMRDAVGGVTDVAGSADGESLLDRAQGWLQGYVGDRAQLPSDSAPPSAASPALIAVALAAGLAAMYYRKPLVRRIGRLGALALAALLTWMLVRGIAP